MNPGELPEWAYRLWHDIETKAHTAEYEMERLTYQEVAEDILEYYDDHARTE